ncbi:MAG: RNA methyltransferase, partial [Sodaliphilus sp.]|nr:RNA methyltransferase [Sodaliphilus sp.]
FGNEGQGIGQKVSKLVNKRLLIPSWNSGETSESLNVGVATAVVISEFRRSVLKNK